MDCDIEATGFTEIEIELRIEGIDDLANADELPILVAAVPTGTQPGDLWQLGELRL